MRSCVNIPLMAKTVIEVRKNPSENNATILRRFSRKVQESGIVKKVKSERYNERKLSKLKTKRATLKRILKRKDIERLKKLGKIR